MGHGVRGAPVPQGGAGPAETAGRLFEVVLVSMFMAADGADHGRSCKRLQNPTARRRGTGRGPLSSGHPVCITEPASRFRNYHAGRCASIAGSGHAKPEAEHPPAGEVWGHPQLGAYGAPQKLSTGKPQSNTSDQLALDARVGPDKAIRLGPDIRAAPMGLQNGPAPKGGGRAAPRCPRPPVLRPRRRTPEAVRRRSGRPRPGGCPRLR